MLEFYVVFKRSTIKRFNHHRNVKVIAVPENLELKITTVKTWYNKSFNSPKRKLSPFDKALVEANQLAKILERNGIGAAVLFGLLPLNEAIRLSKVDEPKED